MDESWISKRRSRRAVGAGALAAALLYATALGRTPARDLSGDCSAEPGVQLLLDWSFGKPVIDITELVPPGNWAQYAHPTMPLFFRYPPDWFPVALWADSFTPNGTPNWQEQPPYVAMLTSGRVISPDGYASFEFASGTITGVALVPEQAAIVAKQGLLGESPRLTSLCTHETPPNLGPGWFHADELESSILVSYGWTAVPAVGLTPTTTVTYYTLFGPQPSFESLMRSVFIPILSQLEGGGYDPTPTPTP